MVAPEGWEIVELDEVAEVKTGPFGSALHAGDYVRIGTPIVTVEHLGEYFMIHRNLPLVSDTDKNRLSAYTLQAGDIIFSRVGSIDRNVYITNYEDGWLFSGRLLRIRVNKTYVYSKFLSYYLKFNTTIQRIKNIAVGQTMASLNTKLLNRFIIAYPPLPEQLRIAEVLSDTDLYITTLERLIAKKEAVKQGVMQELLTGKRRLPGFKDEWVEKRLGEFDIRKGSVITKDSAQIGNIPVIAGGKNVAYYCNEYNREGNTITISASGVNAGFVNFWKCRIFASDCSTIEASSEYDIRLIYYILINRQNDLYKLQTGGAQPHVQPTDMSSMVVFIPPTFAEQTAIAEILSDMDAELSALKKKLEKIRLIKQGMMDALLMGKIRLPEDKPNVQFTQRKEQEEILYAAEKTEEYTANHKKRNKHIDDAVMIAGIVNELYSQKYPLGRKKVQKCLYLLRRHQKRSTTEFKKKAAGPYADEIRYRGGEPIALSAQYIITQKGTKGTLFFKGTNIQQALNYIEQWNMQTDIQWLRERLKFKSVDTLELWATVDMAICDLENMQMPISLSSIKHLIATNEEWKKKLEKPLFNDANIIKAISELRTLFEYKSK